MAMSRHVVGWMQAAPLALVLAGFLVLPVMLWAARNIETYRPQYLPCHVVYTKPALSIDTPKSLSIQSTIYRAKYSSIRPNSLSINKSLPIKSKDSTTMIATV